MDCAEELNLARIAYQQGEFMSAKHHFGQAHGACHDDKKLHLSTHWGLARVALRRKDRVEAIRHVALLSLAAIFT